MKRATCYVYVLFRKTGVPFYVGKGSGNRWLVHEWEARATKPGPNANHQKLAIIRKMQALGFDIPKVKLHEGLTEAVAHAYEAALIATIGRRNKGGPLVNLTDGGDGTSGNIKPREAVERTAAAHRGKKRSLETRAKLAAARRSWTTSEAHLAKFFAGSRKPKSATHRARIGDAQRGQKRGPLSPETRAKLSASSAWRGKRMNYSPTHRANLSAAVAAANRRRAGTPRSPAAIAKTAAANRGRKPSPETCEKIRQAALKRYSASRSMASQIT